MLSSPVRLLLCLGSTLLAIPQVGFAQGDTDLLQLGNARVVNVESGEIELRDITINDGLITAIDPPGRQSGSPDRQLDLKGRYLIPGLWDMHVHFEGRELVEDNALLLPVYLAYGITGVREAASNLASTVLVWRREVAAGKRLGPHIFTAGQKFEGIDSLWDGDREIGTLEQMRAGLDEQAELGVDFIKVTENTLQPELFLATVSEAHRRGFLVSSHIPLGLSVEELAEAGLSSIEHASYLLRLGAPSERTIAQAVREGRMSAEEATRIYNDGFDQDAANAAYGRLAEAGVAVTPTLIGGRQLAWLDQTDHSHDPFLRYLTEAFTAKYQWRIDRMAGESSADSAARKARHQLTARQLPALQAAGVQLLAGSDSAALNTYVYPAEALHKELELFTDAGLTPLQALQAATINGARFMRRDSDYGSIAVGKQADLVVLNDNPLTDIRASRGIFAVIYHGKIFDRAQLDALLEQAALRKTALDAEHR